MTDSTPNDFVRAWRTATDADVARGLANPADYTSEALETLQSEARRRGIAVGDVRPQSPLEDSVYLRLLAPVGRVLWALLTFLWQHRLLTAFWYGVVVRAASGAIAPHVPNIHPYLWLGLFLITYISGLGLLCWPLRTYKTIASIVAFAFLGMASASLPVLIPFMQSGDIKTSFIVLAFLAPPTVGWLAPFAALSGVAFLRNRYRPIYPPGQCNKCGYVLHGLPEPRCPECGTPFEPQESNP